MEKQEQVFHVYSKSEKILFRDEADYRMAINRLSACAHVTFTRAWASAIMSTHFHLVVKTGDVQRFIGYYRRHVSMHYRKRYGISPVFKVSFKLIDNIPMTRTVVSYVLKNPVHHKVVKFPTRYPYSSIGCYFEEVIAPLPLLPQQLPALTVQAPSELPLRRQHQLFGQHSMPSTYKVLGGKVVLPRSFVDVQEVEKLFAGVRDFVYHMNRALSEELKFLKPTTSGVEGLDTGHSPLARLSDIEACRLIDQDPRCKNYGQLSPAEQKEVQRHLMRMGVERDQIARAL